MANCRDSSSSGSKCTSPPLSTVNVNIYISCRSFTVTTTTTTTAAAALITTLFVGTGTGVQQERKRKRRRCSSSRQCACTDRLSVCDCPTVCLCRLPLICRSNRTDWHCFACLAVCLSLSLCYFRLAPATTTTVFAFCWVSSHIYQSSIDWSTDCTAAAAVAGQWPHNSFFFILSFLFFPSVVIKDGCRQGWLKVNERDEMEEKGGEGEYKYYK